MIETKYNYSLTEEKKIEKIIANEHILLNHMVLPQGDRLPEHFSNSNVYMIIVSGIMSIQLGEEAENKYAKGDILNIPFNTKMNVLNKDKEILEFFVIKAPSPENYK